jgi:predicted transcriptional regulator
MTVRRRKPTEAELEILQVLWARGPSSVRAVAEAMDRQDAYTTVLKLLQIMTKKRLVRRHQSGRMHVYAAASSQEQTQQQLVRDLLHRVFEGSAAKLVLQALATGHASAEELAEIQQLLSARRHGSRRPRGVP